MINDYTNGKIKDHIKLIANFDGGCEPKNPNGVCTSAWVIYDGETNEKLAFEGKVVRDGRGKQDKLATNNFAEYCSLGLLLRFLVDNQWRGSITIYGDSKLIVNQVTGVWSLKAEHLRPAFLKVHEHLKTLELEVGTSSEFECCICDKSGSLNELFELGDKSVCPACQNEVIISPKTNCSLVWIPREQNEEADEIGNQTYRSYIGNNK